VSWAERRVGSGLGRLGGIIHHRPITSARNFSRLKTRSGRRLTPIITNLQAERRERRACAENQRQKIPWMRDLAGRGSSNLQRSVTAQVVPLYTEDRVPLPCSRTQERSAK
jgi:hypothetical protein